MPCTLGEEREERERRGRERRGREKREKKERAETQRRERKRERVRDVESPPCVWVSHFPFLSSPSFSSSFLIHPSLFLIIYSLFLVPQMPVEVEVDASDVTAGYESSRRVKFCQDVIPPLSRMVIMVRREGKR